MRRKRKGKPILQVLLIASLAINTTLSFVVLAKRNRMVKFGVVQSGTDFCLGIAQLTDEARKRSDRRIAAPQGRDPGTHVEVFGLDPVWHFSPRSRVGKTRLRHRG